MPCICNSICDNDCSVNQLCTGHAPACSNTFSFVAIAIGNLVYASQVTALQDAINQERANTGRRFNAGDDPYCSTHTPGDLACTNNAFSPTVFTGGIAINSTVLVEHYDEIKDSNNEVTADSGSGSTVTANFIAQSISAVNSVILAVDVTELQTRINQTRNACICDSHCNCDPADCGCDAECPSDDYYYY